jgi:uncharacterized alpha-E superfamily protein
MLLSRVAEHLYWMARYIERAENTARLTNVTSHLLLDLPKGIDLGWEGLLSIIGSRAEFFEHYHVADERNVMRWLLADERNNGSLLGSLSLARENARILRDVLQRELWEEINDLYLLAKREAAGATGRRRRYEFNREVISRRQAILGIAVGTTSQNDAFQFMVIGRNLERADMTSRILDAATVELMLSGDELRPFSNIRWTSVLRSLTAYQMYRQHVQVRVRGPAVLRFLLQDRLFPRTVAFCLRELRACLQGRKEASAGLPNNQEPLRVLSRVLRKIDKADVYALVDAGLHDFLDEVQVGLSEIHVALSTTYFGYPSHGQSQTQSQTSSP